MFLEPMATFLPKAPLILEQYRIVNPHTDFLVGRRENLDNKLKLLREFQQEFPGTALNIHWGEGCNHVKFRRDTPKAEEWLCILLNLVILESEFDFLHKNYAA